MGILAYFIALLIGLSIALFIYLLLAYDWVIEFILIVCIIVGSLLIGIPIADSLGIRP